MTKLFRTTVFFIALFLPILAAANLGPSWLTELTVLASSSITSAFIRILQLVSLPIVFLSITTTLLNQKDLAELKNIGQKVAIYTVSTTLAASLLAAILYHLIQPHLISTSISSQANDQVFIYSNYITNLIPNNFFAAFVEQNVIGVMIIAFGFGIASFKISTGDRIKLGQSLNAIYKIVFAATQSVLNYLPIVIWAFYADLVLQAESIIPAMFQLSRYVMCVISANLIHALITLPLLLRSHGVCARSLFNSMQPTLSIAFWSKSSSAALPSAISCLSTSEHCQARVAKISMPLCISINMNACAAFILITVHFVANLNGVNLTFIDSLAWVFIATLAAIGNAGVPMGCYFLAGALLTSFNIPLEFMGIILPIYGLIDMLESAINVWSDACVSSCVSQSAVVESQNEGPSIIPIR